MDQNTTIFNAVKEENKNMERVLREVYEALKVKGYEPVSQIVGYILSGDPTYITSYENARAKIQKLDRDDLLEELVKRYLEI